MGSAWARAWPLLSLLIGCGSVETTPRNDGSTSSTVVTGSTSVTSSTEPAWPRRVTLTADFAVDETEMVRLEDGAILTEDGDLAFSVGKVLSLSSPTPESLCGKGTFDAVADVPTDTGACPASLGGVWGQVAYLSATTLHDTDDSYVAGLGILARSRDHGALYRLRIIGDSYDFEGHSTVTFDYEPAP